MVLSHRSALQLLDFSVSFKTWNSVHFLGHFLMVAIIVVSMVNPPRKPRKKEAASADKHDKTGVAAPPIQSGEATSNFMCALAMTGGRRHTLAEVLCSTG